MFVSEAAAAASTTQWTTYDLQTWINEYLDISCGVFLLLCAVWGSPANFLALVAFYKSEKGLVVGRLFVWATVLDVLICSSSAMAALPYFVGRQEVLYQNMLVCNASGLVWNVASRMSVLIVVLISGTRVLLALCPLWSQAHRKVLTTSVQLIAVFLLIACIAKSSLPYFYSTSYSFNVYLGTCNFYYDELFHYQSAEYLVLTTIFAMDFLLPLLPIGIGGIIIICVLFQRTSKELFLNKEARDLRLEEAKKKSVTILIFVSVYAICNLPVGFVYTYFLLSEFSADSEQYTLFESPLTSLYVIPAGLVLSVALNSAVNPIIYFSRHPDMHLCSFRSQSPLSPGVGPRRQTQGPDKRSTKTEQEGTVVSRSRYMDTKID